jgi:hypothetical protein
VQLLLFAASMRTSLGETDGEQGPVGRLFLFGGLWGEFDGAPFLKVACHLMPDILLETANDQPFVVIILRCVVIGVTDRGGVEESHERREAPRRAVVRCGRQQDQRVGAAGESLRQARPPRLALFTRTRGDVVTLIDDDDIPPSVVEIIAVFEVVFQRVDRSVSIEMMLRSK